MSDGVSFDTTQYPLTARLCAAVLRCWPEHERFIGQSFSARSAESLLVSEQVSALVESVAEIEGRSCDDFAADYRFMCEKIVFPEEIYFRREGKYRLSTFEEADREVYSNPELMSRYMSGLLVSDAIWSNHANAMADFANAYLSGPGGDGNHLEIGPGHGLLLQLAARFGRYSTMEAWDVSATSLAMANRVIDTLGLGGEVRLEKRNIYDSEVRSACAGRFTSVVLSEVVEHLEEPLSALEAVHGLVVKGGRLWINAPANGPAPDHLFLFRSPAELSSLVTQAGFSVVRCAAFPVTGASLEKATRQQLPISVCIEAVRQ